VVRDLMVDRSRLLENLKRVQGLGAHRRPLGQPRARPAHLAAAWAANYLYSRCMSCGCCMAACPQFGGSSDDLDQERQDTGSGFVGPAPLAQVRLMNAHPTGRYDKAERLHAIMAEGGLSDCGNAQNCVRVCPKEIPLTTAIGELGRQTTVQC
jgi:succinate dehydrogenase / fumarate reductase iron-sulfur subunit